jgi:hypothetical protein
MLFEDRQRTREAPLKRGESLWKFYDTCALPGYDEFRSLINRWLVEMPEKDSQELISRIKYGGNREIGACLCELSVHAWLVRLGFKVTVHPEIPGTTKRPDFAALDEAGALAAYVEVTTVNPQPDKRRRKIERIPSTTQLTG